MALPALLLLGACQNEGAVAPVATVTVTSPASSAPSPSATAENTMCPEIRLQRDANATLAAGGYSQDYSGAYDKMLDELGCAP